MKRRNVHHRHHRRRSNATVAAASSIIIYLCMVAFSSHEGLYPEKKLYCMTTASHSSIILSCHSSSSSSSSSSSCLCSRVTTLSSRSTNTALFEKTGTFRLLDARLLSSVKASAVSARASVDFALSHPSRGKSSSVAATAIVVIRQGLSTVSAHGQESARASALADHLECCYFSHQQGGIDEETEEENEPEHTSDPVVVDPVDVIANVTISNSTDHDDQSTIASSPSETDTHTNSKSNQEKQTGGGGVVGSVVSWFRGPAAASNDQSSTKTTKQIDNTDKIPHGPDGRGGGGTIMTSPSTESDDESNQDSEFERTSDVAVEEEPTDSNKKKQKRSKAKKDHIDSSSMPSESLNESAIVDEQTSSVESQQDHVSSGYWVPIDILSSFGLSTLNDDLKLSRVLRPVRKAVANVTGLHGFVSGKIYTTTNSSHAVITRRNNAVVISIDEELGIHDAGALEAEMLARRVARQRRNRRNQGPTQGVTVLGGDDALEQRRRERVEEIDHLLQRGGERLLELQCERDDLLQAPNPLLTTQRSMIRQPIRHLVTLEQFVSQSDSLDDDDDESVGDDLLTPSADARKLYENLDQLERGGKVRRNGNGGGGGSWLLRTGFGRNGGSLGEKLGETIETAAYKGIYEFTLKEIQTTPVNKKFGENYAEETLKRAIRKGSRKKKKRHSSHRSSSTRQHGYELSDDAFIQRDAVVETLISHCQISAPLLKLFPLDWQRAMVGNIITLVTAIVSDFADGLQFQILGHALSVSFKPITEADMFQQIGVGGFRHNHRRTRPDEFEAAVMATAQDISDSLSFLDGWLEWAERRVGGGVLRSQIGNLIARVVLTLVDEVLSGAKLDLWSSQANGPRLYAALEYRDQSETHPSDE
ncbi:hypothetical protein QTG54_014580 [Skeletonema marinoi]|uniref:Uncharacterized protein n=1 Tax=Skeletonema marinoi TaxID=267567 RepID=A0AAD8XWC8_9STRA|nr:hypothetical protein QTG54_014580 [Skeletonema marinoi]